MVSRDPLSVVDEDRTHTCIWVEFQILKGNAHMQLERKKGSNTDMGDRSTLTSEFIGISCYRKKHDFSKFEKKLNFEFDFEI